MDPEFKVGEVLIVSTPPATRSQVGISAGKNKHYIKKGAKVKVLSIEDKSLVNQDDIYYIVKPLREEDFSWDWNISAISTGVYTANKGEKFTGIQFLRSEDLTRMPPYILLREKDSLPLF